MAVAFIDHCHWNKVRQTFLPEVHNSEMGQRVSALTNASLWELDTGPTPVC